MKRFSRVLVLPAVLLLPLSHVGADSATIDELVEARQAATGFPPAEVCADAVFLRRAYLDVIGTLPTAEEARRFLADRDPGKRAALVDELLARPEFADFWSLKWGDLLRIKAEFPSNLWPNAVHAYHTWIRHAIRDNLPYDQFARALLTTSGSNFRDPPVNFYRPFQERTPRRILETTALVLMGVRLEHSGWTEEELLGLDAFFAKVAYKNTREWKEEIVYSDPDRQLLHPVTGRPVPPRALGGVSLDLAPHEDPRFAFADWLTAPDNPWFARNIVNRIWFWLLGRGIIHEADDVRPDNPPWCPQLLAHLERELVANQYDLRHIYRIILNSRTYQRCSQPSPANAGDEAGFSHYRLRRLEAEVLIDAIDQIFGTGEEYQSAIPEPFTFVPPSRRTINLADGSIKSTFLDLFGRPGRDTSFESERNLEVSAFQSLHLLNSSHIQRKVMRGPGLRQLTRAHPNPRRRVTELYLTALSRFPSPDEERIALEYVTGAEGGNLGGFQDLAWALVNTSEFLIKH